MDEKTFCSELVRLFNKNGMTGLINYEKADKLRKLYEIMCEQNTKFNLTAITDPYEVMLLHYADSLTLSPYLKKGARLIDVGTGAGFPCIPLALCREDLTVLAIDSTEKKVNYINETAALLKINNLTAKTMRAEDGAKLPELREHFDYSVARGVSKLNILCEYLLPYVKIGGQMIAMKGPAAIHETNEAKRAVAMLGAKSCTVVEAPLCDKDGAKLEHTLVFIDKITKTPALYPRENNQIQKKPL